MKLYEGLGEELDFNLLFSQCGHLTLAHSDRAMFVMANRAEVNRLNGIDSRLIGPEGQAAGADDVRRQDTHLSDHGRALSPAGRDHPPRRGGLGVCPRRPTEAAPRFTPTPRSPASSRTGDRIAAVETNRGTIKAGNGSQLHRRLVTLICEMAGVGLPITTHILQACVTEPVKPFLDVVIVSSQMHVYISQSDRGEFVMGSEIEPWTTYRTQNTLNFLQDLTRHTLELFPQLEHARLLRAWAGLCDLLARLQPDPRQDRGRELPRQRRVGDLRVQGGADRRQDAGRAGRRRDARQS